MGVFTGSGLRNANVFERGVFLGVGAYSLTIKNMLVKKTRKSGDGLIVEFVVDESSNSAHPVGSKASWFQKLSDKDVAFGAIKEFCYAVLGLEYPKDKEKIEKEVDPVIEALLDAACDKGEFNGRKVNVQTTVKKTAAKGVDFTVHKWSPAAKAA